MLALYEITLGSSKKKLSLTVENTSIGKVLLMVAQYYGEEWYGCTVADQDGNFCCIDCKEHYTKSNSDKTVYQWALENYVSSMRWMVGLFTARETCDGIEYTTDYNPFTEIE